MKKGKPRPYIDVNVPRDREKYMNEALENSEITTRLDIDNYKRTLSGLGAWIIDQFLLEKTGFRFAHFNLDSNGVKIMDKTTKKLTQIFFKPEGIECGTCFKAECEHIKFALTVDAVKDVIRQKRKENWKVPDV